LTSARAAAGSKVASVLKCARDYQQEDRRHVLKDQDGGGGQTHRAVLLVALPDDPRNNRRRGQRQGSSDQKGRRRRQASYHPERAETERAEQHLDRPKTENVSRLLADMREREVQADVKEQKDDPKFGKDGDRAAIGEPTETARLQCKAEKQIANDRTKRDGAAPNRGNDAKRQQDNDRHKGLQNEHIDHRLTLRHRRQ
jgi:hypothetical protein